MRDYYDNYWSQELPPAVSDPDSSVRRRLLWDLLAPKLGPERRILECGSGDGSLVAESKARGFDAVGMEISRVAIQRAQRQFPGCNFVCHSVDSRPWPLEPRSCDLVVSFEVIEHLMRPRQLLMGAHEVLKPGGYLALTTPYHGRLKSIAITMLGFEEHFQVEGEHIRFFTDRALLRLLSDVGFVDCQLVHFGRLFALWRGVFVLARKPESPSAAPSKALSGDA